MEGLAVGLLVVGVAVAAQFWGVDSREGFAGSPLPTRRWFIALTRDPAPAPSQAPRDVPRGRPPQVVREDRPAASPSRSLGAASIHPAPGH